MRKIKALGALLLAGTMVLGMTGCGTKATYFTTMLDGMSIANYTFDTEISFQTKVKDIAEKDSSSLVVTKSKAQDTVALLLKGTMLETGAMQLDISVSLKSESESNPLDYPLVNLTDILLVDGGVYFNARKVLDTLNTLSGETLIDTSQMAEDYVMLPSETVEETVGDTTVACKAVDDCTGVIGGRLMTLLDSTFADVGSNVLTENKGVYEIAVSQANAIVVLDCVDKLFTVSADELLTACITDITAMGSDTVYIECADALREVQAAYTEEMRTEISKGIAGLKEEVGKLSAFNVIGTTSLTGKEGERVWNTQLKAEVEDINGVLDTEGTLGDDGIVGLSLSVKHTVNEVPATTVIAVPQVTLDFNTLMAKLGLDSSMLDGVLDSAGGTDFNTGYDNDYDNGYIEDFDIDYAEDVVAEE